MQLILMLTLICCEICRRWYCKKSNAAPVAMTSLNVEDEFLAMAELFAEAGVPRETRKVA